MNLLLLLLALGLTPGWGVVLINAGDPSWQCAMKANAEMQSAAATGDEARYIEAAKKALECMPDNEGTYNLAVDTRKKTIGAEYVTYKAGVNNYWKFRYSPITKTPEDCDMLDMKVKGNIILYTGKEQKLKLLDGKSWTAAYTYDGDYEPLYQNGGTSVANVVSQSIKNISELLKEGEVRIVLADPMQLNGGRIFKVRTIAKVRLDGDKKLRKFEYGYMTGGCLQCATDEIVEYLNC